MESVNVAVVQLFSAFVRDCRHLMTLLSCSGRAQWQRELWQAQHVGLQGCSYHKSVILRLDFHDAQPPSARSFTLRGRQRTTTCCHN